MGCMTRQKFLMYNGTNRNQSINHMDGAEMPKLSGNRYLVQVSLTPEQYEILRKAAFDEGVTINKLLKMKALASARRKRRP